MLMENRPSIRGQLIFLSFSYILHVLAYTTNNLIITKYFLYLALDLLQAYSRGLSTGVTDYEKPPVLSRHTLILYDTMRRFLSDMAGYRPVRPVATTVEALGDSDAFVGFG